MKEKHLELVSICLHHFNTDINHFIDNDVYFYDVDAFNKNFKVKNTLEKWFEVIQDFVADDYKEYIIVVKNRKKYLNQNLFIDYLLFLDSDLII